MLLSYPQNQPEREHHIDGPNWKLSIHFKTFSISSSPGDSEADKYYWNVKITYPLPDEERYRATQGITLKVSSTVYEWNSPSEAYDGLVDFLSQLDLSSIVERLESDKIRIMEEAWTNSLHK